MAMEEGISWSVEKRTHNSWSRAVGNKIASFLYLGHLFSLFGGKYGKQDPYLLKYRLLGGMSVFFNDNLT